VKIKISLPAQNHNGAHPTYFRIGKGFLSLGVKCSERGVNHPLSNSGQIEGKLKLQLNFTCALSWRFMGRNLVTHI